MELFDLCAVREAIIAHNYTITITKYYTWKWKEKEKILIKLQIYKIKILLTFFNKILQRNIFNFIFI